VTTIDKALTLLACFSSEAPSRKLTELAHESGMSKAGVFRYLSGLTNAGLVEQDPETRQYRLGAEVIRLAQVRDNSFPIRKWMRTLLAQITDQTGETCHAGLVSQGRLFTYMVNDSPKSLQVRIDPGINLPYHATASGQIFLAFASDEFVDAQLSTNLSAYTDTTVTDPDRIRDRCLTFRQQGYSMSEGGVETDVISVASAFFDAMGQPAGTIAIQAPAVRMPAEMISTYGLLLRQIAVMATRHYGGEVPGQFPISPEVPNSPGRTLSGNTENEVAKC
jgi:DNA-binding IclR family transcriptional regulator